MKFKRLTGIFLALCCFHNAQADLLGVTDAAALAKLVEQLQQLQKQYTLLDKTYKNSQSQLNGMNKLSQMNSGHSGFGRLHNSMVDLNKRQSANSWRETLKGVSGGNPERYKELVTAHEKQHASLNKTQFSRGASPLRTERFEQERTLTQAATIESEVAFNDIKDRERNNFLFSE